MTWRIIRINGDGSVRVILNDTAGTSTFNNMGDNAFIGYMYGASSASTYEETHKNINNSDLKKFIDTWYEQNLKDNYSNYIADSGYCGDRNSLTSNEVSGFGKTTTYYDGYGRVISSKPSLKCTLQSDLYTLIDSNNGNKSLKYSIATITIDEVILAGNAGGIFDGGLNYTGKSNNYLNNNVVSYWTMTPSGGYVPYKYGDWGSLNFYLDNQRIDESWTNIGNNVRPVINLKADVIKYGTGTSSDPYRVTEN